MKYLLTGHEMAEADANTSQVIGIPSIVLMERAALAVTDEISKRFPASAGVTILAGPGNNGADGLAVGRLLTDRGYRVQFLLLDPKEPPEGTSAWTQRRILDAYGIKPETFDEDRMKAFEPSVIVDALFGTGLGRPLTGRAAAITEAVTVYRVRTGCTVVGLDLPSGISSEDGSVMGCAVQCDFTVTFAYYKRGHFLYPGCNYCGETILRQIGIHDRSFTCAGGVIPEMVMPERADITKLICRREPGGNKGTFGKILIIAGSYSMCGAALLCAEACMRAGAGMVKIFTREENRVIIQEKLPEAMLTVYAALPEEAEQKASKFGMEVPKKPGAYSMKIRLFVREDGTASIWGLEEYIPHEPLDVIPVPPHGRLIDADALRIIASEPEFDELMRHRNKETACILTPHLAEFADLAHVTVKMAAADRTGLLKELCGRYGCTVIGKDARTLVASAGLRQISMITKGNSGMATAGSGDVLTGITAAMLFSVSPGEEPGYRAAQAAAFIHAEAGDAARDSLGEHSMVAGDLIRAERGIFRLLTE